jgi:hypothetical protein
LYQKLASSEGGLNGLLSNLKDKDMQGVLDEIKKVGGDDVKRVVEKVEGKIKDAKGDASKVDWKSLAQELKGELPASAQKAVDVRPSSPRISRALLHDRGKKLMMIGSHRSDPQQGRLRAVCQQDQD